MAFRLSSRAGIDAHQNSSPTMRSSTFDGLGSQTCGAQRHAAPGSHRAPGCTPCGASTPACSSATASESRSQARLGHASAAETLDTYSHLWPDSEDRTRQAIDSVLGAPADCV